MDVPISDAGAQIVELVRLAEAGEDVVLTYEGKAAVRLTPVEPRLSGEALLDFMKRLGAEGARKATPGPSAARSQDCLYDENGMPG